MYRERETIDVLTGILKSKGYDTQDPSQRIWTRQQKKVIVCLADDFVICGAIRNNPPAMWFDNNTTVVTDNYMPHLTNYRILTFPSSYFGVFNYVPELQTFNPTRRFGLSINRMDTQRILALLELVAASGGVTQLLENDWINFNGFDPGFVSQNKEDVKSNFFKYLDEISQHLGDRYSDYVSNVASALPIRNHTFTIEQAHISSYLTLVIETYAGNDTIAFSEKIFRALVTPSPWMLFSARNAVQYLKTLGFDIVDDLIDHSYDSNFQHYPGLDKFSNFYNLAKENYQKLLSINVSTVATRYRQSATHNQQLLQQFQLRWPEDFKKFLLTLDNTI
jgi:hypothetical protein